ncbi:DUF2917 domain-containing protein [Undibacterium sp. TJN25]|uniref:DUF2917 domain-containing protein n=1 Tax=Undibacterium sp. TJN25 TaxID=3413056 RepID=UPI003BF30E88
MVRSNGSIRVGALLELERRSALAICHDAGVRLHCSRGSLWVTQLGNAEDEVLGPGQELHVRAGQDLVIQAFSASTLQVELCSAHAGKDDRSDSMTVNFVDQWYRQPDQATRLRFSIEGPFGLAVQAPFHGK